jgi:predicted MPP superfamily phosphohydrolase
LKDLEMYVSRGVGTSIIRLRLFVPPEIVVLTLHCK